MKRITLFAGHYGSGKTNVAVNYALHLKEAGLNVVIADLDIVNPYFRTKDSIEELGAAGIELISSEYAGTNVDFPALPQGMYSLTDDKSRYAVMDIGGDDRGAYALGRYKDAILAENDYEMLFVINKYRPLTATALLTMGIKEEVERACGIKFTGIVNNSNLGELTTAEDVISTLPYANEVSRLSGLPVLFTSVTEDVAEQLKQQGTAHSDENADFSEFFGKEHKLFTIHLQKKVYNSR